MKVDILITAALLTAIISFAAPTKADNLSNLDAANLSQSVVASSVLSPLEQKNTTTELKFVTYDPYPFGTVNGVVILSHQDGIGCLLGDRTTSSLEGAVTCGIIDRD
jgi:hypothetical protein